MQKSPVNNDGWVNIDCLTIRYDTIRYGRLTCAQKLTRCQLNLAHVRERKNNEKNKIKNWVAQKKRYRQTSVEAVRDLWSYLCSQSLNCTVISLGEEFLSATVLLSRFFLRSRDQDRDLWAQFSGGSSLWWPGCSGVASKLCGGGFTHSHGPHKCTYFDDIYVIRRFSAQGCAFWGLIRTAPHFGVRSPKTPYFRGVKRHFQD